MTSTTPLTFRSFLLQKENKLIIGGSVLISLTLFFIFKYYYPFINYIHGDSFSYLGAAKDNLSINTYLIGYSKFLRIFNTFVKSDYILSLTQYLLLQGAALYFAYSFFYIFRASKTAIYIIVAFITVNPLSLHLANLVSSDGLFAACSFIWLATLLWLINKPTLRIAIIHSLIIFFAFTLRYNALIYPFFSLLSMIIFVKGNNKLKLASIAVLLIPVSLFIISTGNQYQKLTGVWQYSPFSGWQWANNALYTYRYVPKSERKPVPTRFKALDSMVTKYFDKPKNTQLAFLETIKASSFYMWSKGMPLYDYRDKVKFPGDTSTAAEFRKWATMGPLYKDYGIHIIKTYPKEYFLNFVIPNAGQYFSPPIEFLSYYNGAKKTISKDTQRWFNYKSQNIHTRFVDPETFILNAFPALSGATNMILLLGLLAILISKQTLIQNNIRTFVLLCGMFWITNAGFTVFASPAALRFQAFPLLISTITSILIIENLFRIAFKKATLKNQEEPLQIEKKNRICINQCWYRF